MPDNAVETVTIPLSEYEELLHDSLFLNALYNVGVDSWDGYGIAQESMDETE